MAIGSSGIGSSQLISARLWKTLLFGGFSAPLLGAGLIAIGSFNPAQAQPKGAIPASEQLDSNSASEANSAREAKVLISEVAVVGLRIIPIRND